MVIFAIFKMAAFVYFLKYFKSVSSIPKDIIKGVKNGIVYINCTNCSGDIALQSLEKSVKSADSAVFSKLWYTISWERYSQI
jgi:hypothetical protein